MYLNVNIADEMVAEIIADVHLLNLAVLNRGEDIKLHVYHLQCICNNKMNYFEYDIASVAPFKDNTKVIVILLTKKLC